MAQPAKVFISYAHADEPYKDTLNIHLTPYERRGIIKIWDDRDILPGQVWDTEIKEAVLNADVILFLISPSFMASGYIDGVELKSAMQLHFEKKLILIPIIIRPSNLSLLDLTRFQAVPKNAKPISTWENPDEAWLDVSQQLDKVFKAIVEGTYVLQKESSLKLDETNKATNTKNPIASTSGNLNDIKKLIQQGKLEQAIKSLLIYAEGKDESLHNDVILQSSRYNSLARDEMQGIIPYDRAQLTKNQITNGLLGIIRNAENE
jgi:hypothetical protein